MNSGKETPIKIDKAALCVLIPHSGDMCLLKSVEYWDRDSIVCETGKISHTLRPLRHQGRISALAMLELGAQAMAVHGGLLAKCDDKPFYTRLFSRNQKRPFCNYPYR